jgi:outer membrane protein assembly factor BamE (lipoprotein component of BamABCDE complex)
MLVLAALIVIAGWPAHSHAQAARSAGSTRALTERAALSERAAVDLRPGMTPDEVRELLGKPWRTALSGNSGGTLRWTYTWSGSPSSGPSERERILNVDFNAKTAEQWSVSAWNWSAY